MSDNPDEHKADLTYRSDSQGESTHSYWYFISYNSEMVLHLECNIDFISLILL
jgi:hypothetical protein